MLRLPPTLFVKMPPWATPFQQANQKQKAVLPHVLQINEIKAISLIDGSSIAFLGDEEATLSSALTDSFKRSSKTAVLSSNIHEACQKIFKTSKPQPHDAIDSEFLHPSKRI